MAACRLCGGLFFAGAWLPSAWKPGRAFDPTNRFGDHGYLAYVLFLETACRWGCYFCVAKSRLLLFLPHQVLDALTPFHLPESVNHLIADAHVLSNQLTPAEAIVAAVFYIGLFALLFCLKIVKSDL